MIKVDTIFYESFFPSSKHIGKKQRVSNDVWEATLEDDKLIILPLELLNNRHISKEVS